MTLCSAQGVTFLQAERGVVDFSELCLVNLSPPRYVQRTIVCTDRVIIPSYVEYIDIVRDTATNFGNL